MASPMHTTKTMRSAMQMAAVKAMTNPAPNKFADDVFMVLTDLDNLLELTKALMSVLEAHHIDYQRGDDGDIPVLDFCNDEESSTWYNLVKFMEEPVNG